MLQELLGAGRLGYGLAAVALVFVAGLPFYRLVVRRLLLKLFSAQNRYAEASARRLAWIYVVLLAIVALEVGRMTAGLFLPSPVEFWIERLLGPIAAVFALEIVRIVLLDGLVGSQRRVPKILHDIAVALIYMVVGLVFLSEVFGVNLAPILTFSGLFSIVLGLALQDTLGNLFSGLAINMEPPFEIGDWVNIDGSAAQIREITWRAVKALTPRQELVVIPNATVGKAKIVNYSRPTAPYAEELSVGVSYDAAPADATTALEDCLAQCPGVLREPAPTVFLLRFDDSTQTFRVRFFLERFENRDQIVADLHSRIWYKFQQEGLEIAYPTRTVLSPDNSRRTEREREIKLSAFEAVEFLSALSDAERQELASGARVLKFGADEIVFRQDQPGDSLYIIFKGRVELLFGLGDEARRFAVLQEGAVFGEMALLTGEPRSGTVRTLTPCDLVVLTKADLDPLFHRRPEVPMAISRVVASHKATISEERKRREREIETRVAQVNPHETDNEAATLEIFNKIKTFFKLV